MQQMESETVLKSMAVLEDDRVKGWRLSLLDNFGERYYSSPIIPEAITVTISHRIAAGSIEDSGLLVPDSTVGGEIEVEGSGLLAPHLERGVIGLEVWTAPPNGHPEDLKKYPLRWWVFPCIIHGELFQSSQWGSGPDGDWLIEAEAMWHFMPTGPRQEFPTE
jgi:hypothetical protein